MNDVGKVISKSLFEIANAIELGMFKRKIKIGLTLFENDNGIDCILNGAHMAKSILYDIVLIGAKVQSSEFEIVQVKEMECIHKKMEELLAEKYIDIAVTMNYTFPIGVSTVGRINSPVTGKQMLIATTTGTSSVNRVSAMIKNSVYGMIVAKTIGIVNPSVGILNVDGSRVVEKALMKLKENGYDINFATSVRKSGDKIMRGNDILVGTADIVVCDTFTGNLVMKFLSCFNSGGKDEVVGFGYGPAIHEGYDNKILIVSKTSQSNVIANSIVYAYELVIGKMDYIKMSEFESANKAKIQEILQELDSSSKNLNIQKTSKEILDSSICGIDIMNIEETVCILKKNKIYAESAMGCVGPVILLNKEKIDTAIKILTKKGYTVCENSIY